MQFRTPVELPDGSWQISHSDPLLLMGSCFSEHIGQLLVENKFTCDVNPFGVLYNPASMARALGELCDGKVYAASDLVCRRGEWHSMMHHGSFSAADPAECLARINRRLSEGAARLREAKWLILTWGTARVYEWEGDGRVAGNCHKFPAREFCRRLLTSEEIIASHRSLIQRLLTLNPALQILLTVSPIRHAKDGMHGNQVSKATLLLAADALCDCFPNVCHYFPSYEIVMDELRDYRFYADDMLHPSPIAVAYVWECFSQIFTPGTRTCIQQWESIRKALAHRPFHPETEEYRTFLRQILLKIEAMKEKFPYLDVENEQRICLTRLKK